jgi:hypothetical protein
MRRKESDMSTKLMLAIAALGTLGSGIAFASPEKGSFTDNDPLQFLRAGEFMLQDGQVQGIANDDEANAYRICVGKAEHRLGELTGLEARTQRDVALKVMFDGQASTVKPGTCSDFRAKEIKITANDRLADNEVLMGRYEHLG